MACRSDLKLESESSQFRIEENSKRKRAGGQNKNNRYSVISYEKRVQLISLASSKGYSISRAARELGIKPSTGKFIVKCFRDYGKIMKKTNSCLPTLKANCEYESSSEPENKNVEKKEKQCNSSNKEQQRQETQEKIEIPGFSTEFVNESSPTYYFSYPWEQPRIGQILIYPNYETMGMVTMPIFFPQMPQY